MASLRRLETAAETVGLLAEIGANRRPKRADPLADVEGPDPAVAALGLEEVRAGDQIGLDRLLAARLEGGVRTGLERHRGIVDPLAPLSGAGQEHDHAV